MLARVSLLAVLGLAAPGCGGDRQALPASCAEGPGAVLRALARAPRSPALGDGTRLSECVARAYGDGELQQLGYTLTPAADRLAVRGTARAAYELGFLIGAVHRGASRTNGIHGELVRRLDGTATFDDPRLVVAARRGIQAGESSG